MNATESQPEHNNYSKFFIIIESCNEPLNHSIVLPSSCEISFYSGERVNASNINIGRCSNKLCAANNQYCNTMRCCCQTLMYQNLEYSCDDSPPGLYNSISIQCGCVPCTVNVSVIGLVVDEQNNPLPFTNVIVNDETILMTDSYGMFGLLVSALHHDLTVAVSMSSFYSLYYCTVPVLPGQVNLILIQLISIKIAFFTRIESPLFVSMTSLDRYSSVDEFVLLANNDSSGDSLIGFTGNYFDQVLADDLQFQTVPIEIDSNDALFLIKDSFVTDSSMRLDKRQINLVTILSIAAFGSFQVLNEYGQNIIITNDSTLIITTHFDTNQFTVADIESFDLFLYNNDTKLYQQRDASSDIDIMGDKFVTQYNLSDAVLSMTYVIGRRVTPFCYTVVRVFDEWNEVNRSVIIVTRQSYRNEVSLFLGGSSQCIPIPCEGNLFIRINDHFNIYQPSEITYSLNNNVTQQDKTIYTILEDCLSYGVQSNDSTKYFTVHQITRLPDFPPLDTLDVFENIDINTFCYIRVEVFYCDSKTIKVTLLNTVDKTIDHSRVIHAMTKNNDKLEEGSGMACHYSKQICLEYICDPVSHVNISASYCNKEQCSSEADYSSCYPLTVKGGILTRHVTGSFVSFNSTIIDKSGIYYSNDSRDIAYYKCELDDSIALQYECQ